MLGVWVVMALMAIVEVPILMRKKMWGELAAFSVLWVSATLYASLIAADIPIPSVAQIIISIFSPMFSR